jgi:hypothetical protein
LSGGIGVEVEEDDDDDPEHPATARVSPSTNHPSPKARPTFPQEPPTELIIPYFPAVEELVEIQAAISSSAARDQTVNRSAPH